MDRDGDDQDNPNIEGRSKPTMHRVFPDIPVYALYGTNPEESLSEGLHFESIEERSRLHDWEIRAHRHAEFHQFLYLHRGSGIARVDGRERSLGRMTLVHVPPMSVHGFSFGRGVDGFVLTVTQSRIRSFASAASDLLQWLERPQVLSLKGEDSQGLRGVVAMLRQEFAKPQPWRGVALATTIGLMLVLVCRHGAERALESGVPGRAVRHFQKFLVLLEQHYADHRPISVYADALGLTSTQLNRVCRQMSGKTVGQCLQQRLIAEAQRALFYTDLDIQQIATSLGFDDPGYFTRFFVKNSGCTPTLFRTRARAMDCS